jgi:nodulation protein S (NodS)/putative polysaccharide biosynthesis protein
MRLTVAAVVFDAAGQGALTMLWGRGAIRTLLRVQGVIAVVTIGLTVALIKPLGLPGAALALAAGTAVGAGLGLSEAAHVCQVSAAGPLRGALKGVLPAALACGFAVAACHLAPFPGGWGLVIVSSLVGGTIFAAVLYALGGPSDERQLLEEALVGLRHVLRRIGFVRSGVYRAIALADWARNPSNNSEAWDREFARQKDPWGYDSPEGQARFHLALKFLDTARGTGRFRRAFEIGCAEGAFTEMLMPRCESLLAVDWSPVALERARERSPWNETVRFDRWDLRRDPMPGVFDLIVVMSVLEYFGRRGDLRAARDKLVAGLAPGGYLLVGNVRQSDAYETSWWGKYLVRGGKWMNQFIAEGPGLRLLDSVIEPHYVFTLIRKVA